MVLIIFGFEPLVMTPGSWQRRRNRRMGIQDWKGAESLIRITRVTKRGLGLGNKLVLVVGRLQLGSRREGATWLRKQIDVISGDGGQVQLEDGLGGGARFGVERCRHAWRAEILQLLETSRRGGKRRRRRDDFAGGVSF